MHYTKEQITHWLTQWEQSGESISKFCENKPFNKATFYIWRKKLQLQSAHNSNSGFVSLENISGSMPVQISITYPNGVKIHIHYPLSGYQIRELAGC